MISKVNLILKTRKFSHVLPSDASILAANFNNFKEIILRKLLKILYWEENLYVSNWFLVIFKFYFTLK